MCVCVSFLLSSNCVSFQEHKLDKGTRVYVNDDEVHCFKNIGDDSFDFICIVPPRGEG